MCGFGATDSSTLRAWIDTDAPETREWALSVFERYRDEVQPADESDMEASIPEEITSP